MMIQMVDKPNTTPIGQDRGTLFTRKSVDCFGGVYPIVQLRYEYFVVNQNFVIMGSSR